MDPFFLYIYIFLLNVKIPFIENNIFLSESENAFGNSTPYDEYRLPILICYSVIVKEIKFEL